MGSTIRTLLVLVLGCAEDERKDAGRIGDPRDPPEPTEPTEPTEPSCPSDGSGTPLEPVVRLFPEDRGDWAGRDLDVFDADCDGRTEILVASDWSANPLSEYDDERSAVYLLRPPIEGGALAERSVARWQAADETVSFGQQPVLLPSTAQVGIASEIHTFEGEDGSFAVYPLPSGAMSDPIPSDSYVTYVDDHLYEDLHIVSFSARCALPSGPALCLSGTSVGNVDFQGHVLVYELPLATGSVPVMSFTSWLVGDAGDSARTLAGDDDLDGDGRADLVVGAYGWNGAKGRLAIVTEIPAGEHRLWDVASATLSGEAEGEELGLGLATGDVDGDGYVDVLAGSPLGDGGAYVFGGPFAGDRTASSATVSVGGGSPGEWLGYAVAAGDLTADGGADLAVGAPWSIYDPDAPPGAVLVFDDPRGALDAGEATWRLTSGVTAPDAFGIAVKQGDVDGDGFGDLVIGAPRDPTVARDAGSVTIVSGAGLD